MCSIAHGLNIKSMKEAKRHFVHRRKIWKLKQYNFREEFFANFKQNLEERDMETDVEGNLTFLKRCLLETSDKVCGRTKRPVR